MNPTLIAFGRVGEGIYLSSLGAQKITQLTDEGSHSFFWTADGQHIVYLASLPKDEPLPWKRKTLVRMVNVETGSSRELSLRARFVHRPAEINAGEIVYWVEDLEERAPIPTRAPRKLDWPFVYEKNGQVFLRRGGQDKQITSGDRLFNPQLSPDGRRVSYNGGGLYVYSVADGTTIQVGDSDLAGGAAWSPDGKFIAYQVTKGDGHNTTASALFIATSDGQVVAELTNGPCARPMHPSWSPDGKTLTFDCDGGIFIVPCQPK
ncbi:MAG TPA: hypothetical protein VLB32_08895 [Candidatus Acidoferrales bacterium]|nr:hypothetical protein [Candidatus Acidoferrales bacterium]